MTGAPAQAGYGELLRHNPAVRWLWIGSVVSLFGDWFNTMAVFALVERLTGSPLALGLVLATKLLGFAAFGLPGGLLADRLSRKALMIGSDLARALVVLAFLLVDAPGDVPLLIALLALQVGLGAVFDPAFRAALPTLTTPRELLTANALLAATWSALLALGAAIGGFATAELGVDAVFAIDAATYLVSAYCVSRVALPAQPRQSDRPTGIFSAARADLVLGWHYVRARPPVARLALSKAAWAVGGGGLVYFLTQLGPLLAPADGALGVGLLFSARGVGTGLGPILARRYFADRRRWPALIGACVATSGVAYALLPGLGWTFAVIVPIVVAHAASGANWVLSTVLLQERVDNALLGRVFGAEMMILMLVEAASTVAAAALLELGALSLASGLILFALVQTACGVLFMVLVPRAERREAAAAPQG